MRRELFDETFYLATYADIREAVGRGQFSSGWAHFLKHGRFEDRRASADQTAPFTAAPGSAVDEVLMAEKSRLEIAMRGAPQDVALRQDYFGVLDLVSRSGFGAFFANLPEIRTPLMFRGGSSDFWNLRQIFIEGGVGEQAYAYGDYQFPIPPPRRILDLGAYAGYTAVYFANRFPDASIIAVEPSSCNFHVLRANTAPYPTIRCLHAAVWHETTMVATARHLYGDWGTQYAAGTTPAAAIPGYTISDIVRMQDWDSVDFIKCILEGEQVAVLTAADRPWLSQVSCVATKPTPAGRFPLPDDEAKVLAAFPADQFEVGRHTEMIFFTRRSALQATGPTETAIVRLVPRPPALQRITLRNVPGEYEFYRFDEAAMSLLSNPPGAPPISVSFPVELAGQTGFSSGIASDFDAMQFGLMITNAAGEVVLDATFHGVSGETVWTATFGRCLGSHLVTLSVQPDADGRPGWARFFDPRLS